MRHSVLVVGKDPETGGRLAERFRGDGYDVTQVGGRSLPDPSGAQTASSEQYDACVAHWADAGTCPAEFMRDYQTANPRGRLVCCSARPGPWARVLLLDAGVTPDAVISGPGSYDQAAAEVRRLLAFDRRGASEQLVVCVDDDPEFLWSIEQSLPGRVAARAPFETAFEFLNDPLEALALLEECQGAGSPVAMIITDEVMPGLKGVDLLGHAKKLVPFAVRVLLTGQAGMDSVARAVNSRALDHYVSKPVADLDGFAQTLGHLLKEYYLSVKGRHESWQAHEQYQFLKRLTTLGGLDETLQVVVQFVADTLEAERVSVMLCEDGRLTIRASVGVPEDVVAATSVPLGKGIAGKVFATGAPLYVTDPSQLETASAVESPCSVFASVPLLVAPMTVAERPLGIINITDRRADRPLEPWELVFLSHTADVAAIAVSNRLERRRHEEANFATIRSLALAVEAKDRYTRGHSERVALWSVRIAQELELPPQEIENIERAAVLHDVGKIGVPESVIHKPAKLTDEEFAFVRSHPVVGERIVSQLAFMAESLPIIRSHHERLSGGGYPDGLSEEQIPLGARIVAVADAYDAMTSERPYREPMPRKQAVEELTRCSGTQFDPRCVEALVRLLEEEDTTPSVENDRVSIAPG